MCTTKTRQSLTRNLSYTVVVIYPSFSGASGTCGFAGYMREMTCIVMIRRFLHSQYVNSTSVETVFGQSLGISTANPTASSGHPTVVIASGTLGLRRTTILRQVSVKRKRAYVRNRKPFISKTARRPQKTGASQRSLHLKQLCDESRQSLVSDRFTCF